MRSEHKQTDIGANLGPSRNLSGVCSTYNLLMKIKASQPVLQKSNVLQQRLVLSDNSNLCMTAELQEFIPSKASGVPRWLQVIKLGDNCNVSA